MGAIIAAVLISLTLTGCLFGKKKNDGGNKENNATPTVQATGGETTATPQVTETKQDDPGRLTGLRYESSGGSMEFHSEFDIDVNEKEIVHLSYYSNYYFDDLEYELGDDKLAKIDNEGRAATDANSWDKYLVERNNVGLDSELWNVVVEEIEYLKPKLTECPEFTKEDSAKRDSELQVLDGGDYTLLHLTWEKDGSSYTRQYYIPGGNRWSTVVRALHEMARPVGRDLKRVGPTQLTRMYLKTPDYSYQISPVKDEPDTYYYFAYDDKNVSKKLKTAQWAAVRDYIDAMDLSGTELGGYSDKLYLQVEYNDGNYYYYLIDKNTAKELREFIVSQGY